jgi:hypothetical protein
MPSKMISRSFAFALLVVICTLRALAQSPTPPEAADNEQFVAYWTTETGWHSELQLRNNRTNGDLVVTPALRLSDGAETALAPVTIRPQEVQSLDLEAAITSAAPQLVVRLPRAPLSFQRLSKSLRRNDGLQPRPSYRLPY